MQIFTDCNAQRHIHMTPGFTDQLIIFDKKHHKFIYFFKNTEFNSFIAEPNYLLTLVTFDQFDKQNSKVKNTY